MSDNPLVSIVIPVYNGANYLAEAIDSALEQSYNNTEVIVVNDGSNDNEQTRNIALSYGASIIYYEKGNGGVSTALNFAIDKMNGQFFSWLSHDDKYYPWKIEKQVEFYLSLPSGKNVVFSHYDTIDSKGTIINSADEYIIDSNSLVLTLLFKSFIGGCTLLIPSEAFRATGYFSNNYKTVQDYDMWFRMIDAGYKFVYLPITSSMTRIHDKQDTKTKKDVMIEEKNIFFVDLQKWLRKDVWYDLWKDKALLFFYLALQYKKNNLMKLYRHNLLTGFNEMQYLPCIQKIRAYGYALYVMIWIKYFSPMAYYFKGRLLLLQLIALLNNSHKKLK